MPHLAPFRLRHFANGTVINVLNVTLFHFAIQSLPNKYKHVFLRQQNHQAVFVGGYSFNVTVVVPLNLSTEYDYSEAPDWTREVIAHLLKVTCIQVVVILALEYYLRCVV